jgi:Flp pilus assembly pilin Flp
MNQWLRKKATRKGQSMVEYAIILVLVACVCIAVIATTGNQVVLTFQDIEETLLDPGDPGASAVYTCPDGTPAVLHGHKYHCH